MTLVHRVCCVGIKFQQLVATALRTVRVCVLLVTLVNSNSSGTIDGQLIVEAFTVASL